MAKTLLLLPRPQRIAETGGQVTLRDGALMALAVPEPAKLLFSTGRVKAALAEAGLHWDIVGGDAVPEAQVGVRFALNDTVKHEQGYRLVVTASSVIVEARNEVGLHYGTLTLCQLIRQGKGQLPLLVIEDWPDLPRRGVMLDVTRAKVPMMDTLYSIVDMLAGWKINEFQLYVEHAFAYRQHPAVWDDASPITAEDILALNAYCQERFIDLVPNQNSFGHMQRWFKHERYRSLAETESGALTPFGDVLDLPFSLAPTDETLHFLAGLYDELLPNFTSKRFNVGCDETFDLGLERSKALVEKQGKGRVYLDFLLRIYNQLKERGLIMQFWGDIIAHYPDLAPAVPKDVLALIWGYDARHDYPGQCALFEQAGVPFYVCPGTSSWTSIAGRTDNAIGNVRGAVSNGLKHGAAGMLLTDWGDLGHWQTLPVSFLGYVVGTAMSWAYEANSDLDVPAALDAFAFQDTGGVMGRLAYDLGNIYKRTGLGYRGNIPTVHPFWAFHWPLRPDRARLSPRFAGHFADLDEAVNLPGKLHEALDSVDQVISRLPKARMARPDAERIADEYALTAAMLKHGFKRMLLILEDKTFPPAMLYDELGEIQERYRAQWLARNRPGGLVESESYLQKARDAYQAL